MTEPINRPGSVVEIVDEEDIIRWQFVNPDTKQTLDSVFMLRVVPNSLQKELRKRHTKYEFTRRGREEMFDWAAFADEALDYAIVGWEKVMRRGEELPCERAYKSRLPEVVKSEIMRLCVGRELGEIMLGQTGHADEQGGETDPNRPSGTTASGGTTLRAVGTPPAAGSSAPTQ